MNWRNVALRRSSLRQRGTSSRNHKQSIIVSDKPKWLRIASITRPNTFTRWSGMYLSNILHTEER